MACRKQRARLPLHAKPSLLRSHVIKGCWVSGASLREAPGGGPVIWGPVRGLAPTCSRPALSRPLLFPADGFRAALRLS